jgi:GTP-binding protein EngB required for normal cell division
MGRGAISTEAVPLAAMLETVTGICRCHRITALEGFLEVCRKFAEDEILNVAVLGRFKAGKSSFLNYLIGRPLLPVGVTPITAAVTEIQYGAEERAVVTFLDGNAERVPVTRIGEFISEAENPENAKHVARVRVELPSLERFRGIRFVDTPGLDSVFEHNTGASLDWLPNVGMALVAVGVDPPLSQHDIELLRKLRRYTPRIALLLTKVDVVEEADRQQIQDFVEGQLSRLWGGSLPVFPFSIRPGFDAMRGALDERLLGEIQRDGSHQRSFILRHKLRSLIEECTAYLTVALRAAEVSAEERAQLRQKVLGRKETIEDARLTLRLIVRNAAAGVRPRLEAATQTRTGPPSKAPARRPRSRISGLEPQSPRGDGAVRGMARSLAHARDGGAVPQASGRVSRASSACGASACGIAPGLSKPPFGTDAGSARCRAKDNRNRASLAASAHARRPGRKGL